MAPIEMPLFPLRTVLFPGQPLPLRIFEERYKTMVAELLETGGHFGVLLIKAGPEVGGGAIPYTVGTTAAIEEAQPLEDGRYLLTARGVQRFRLVRMLPPRPYPYGEVELIDDSAPADAARVGTALETVRTIFPVYFRLALALTNQWAEGLRLPEAPHALVNFIAQWLQTDEETKQRLLELEPAHERLALLAEVLDELIGRTRREVTEHHRAQYGGLGSTN